MKLELGIMAGESSKQFLMDLTKLVERMEKAVGGKSPSTDESEEDDDTDFGGTTAKTAKATKGRTDEELQKYDDASREEDDSEDDDFTTKKTSTKKATKGFDDEDQEEEEEEAPAPKAAKAAKPKKLTLDDVNDACKARALKTTRADVLGILKKKFKVKSVSDLEAEQYSDVIKAMQAKA